MPLLVLKKTLERQCETEKIGDVDQELVDGFPKVISTQGKDGGRIALFHLEKYNDKLGRRAVVGSGGIRSESSCRNSLTKYKCMVKSCAYAHNIKSVNVKAKDIQLANQLCAKKGTWETPNMDPKNGSQIIWIVEKPSQIHTCTKSALSKMHRKGVRLCSLSSNSIRIGMRGVHPNILKSVHDFATVARDRKVAIPSSVSVHGAPVATSTAATYGQFKRAIRGLVSDPNSVRSYATLRSLRDKMMQENPHTTMWICPAKEAAPFKHCLVIPGPLKNLLRRSAESEQTPCLLDIDYRHHDVNKCGFRGTYNLVLQLPDRSAVEVATMVSAFEENHTEALRFVDGIAKECPWLDTSNVGIMGDYKFIFVQKVFKKAEFRSCIYHAKRNVRDKGLGADNACRLGEAAKATTKARATRITESFSEPMKRYCEQQPQFQKGQLYLSETRLMWRGRTASSLSESLNGAANKAATESVDSVSPPIRSLPITAYVAQWCVNQHLKCFARKREVQHHITTRGTALDALPILRALEHQDVRLSMQQQTTGFYKTQLMCTNTYLVSGLSSVDNTPYTIQCFIHPSDFTQCTCECNWPIHHGRACRHMTQCAKDFGVDIPTPPWYTYECLDIIMASSEEDIPPTSTFEIAIENTDNALQPPVNLHKATAGSLPRVRIISKAETARLKKRGVRVQICLRCGCGGHRTCGGLSKIELDRLAKGENIIDRRQERSKRDRARAAKKRAAPTGALPSSGKVKDARGVPKRTGTTRFTVGATCKRATSTKYSTPHRVQDKQLLQTKLTTVSPAPVGCGSFKHIYPIRNEGNTCWLSATIQGVRSWTVNKIPFDEERQKFQIFLNHDAPPDVRAIASELSSESRDAFRECATNDAHLALTTFLTWQTTMVRTSRCRICKGVQRIEDATIERGILRLSYTDNTPMPTTISNLLSTALCKRVVQRRCSTCREQDTNHDETIAYESHHQCPSRLVVNIPTGPPGSEPQLCTPKEAPVWSGNILKDAVSVPCGDGSIAIYRVCAVLCYINSGHYLTYVTDGSTCTVLCDDSCIRAVPNTDEIAWSNHKPFLVFLGKGTPVSTGDDTTRKEMVALVPTSPVANDTFHVQYIGCGVTLQAYLLRCLAPGEWLFAEIINSVLHWEAVNTSEASGCAAHPGAIVIPSFVVAKPSKRSLSKLWKKCMGHSNVENWRDESLSKILLVSNCDSGHYRILSIGNKRREVIIYDSMRRTGRETELYKAEESFLDDSPWKGFGITLGKTELQSDGFSCGIFAIMHGRRILKGATRATGSFNVDSVRLELLDQFVACDSVNAMAFETIRKDIVKQFPVRHLKRKRSAERHTQE
eukprot:m.107073 g.107073  ORF g.107073 m.107073 type:complete len:1339 (+) comp16916_c0_seq20:82-4098(+)